MSTLIVVFLFVGLIHNAAGACTFPTDLTGTWISSDRGSITFNSTHVIDYPVYNQGDLAFACETLAGNYYVLLSEEFTLFSSPAIAVMCITFTSLKESMYKYQIFTSSLPDADYQRIRFAATGTSVDTSLACTDLGATDYYLLVQDGQISSVKQQCPDIFLGTFRFSFNESDCANNTGYLDVCSDLNTLTFNYTDCSTQQAYSSGGNLNCLYSTTSGDVTTVNVYNLDATTDESTTYRFTCYMIEQPSGSSNVYATQHPKDCHVNQTSTYVPAPGANLTMLASVTCVPSTTTADTVSQASLIAGLAAGFIVLLLLALLIVCFYCYKKKSKVQPTGKAPIDTDHGDQHPDTICAETTASTPAAVEIVQDVLSVLHETELNNAVNKQPKPKEGASISLKGNKDSNLQQLKRSDRQSSVRFSVSNLKKKQANKKTKTETKVKPSSKPSVPKKRLPWPALFLPPENDTRKEKERETKRKLTPHNTQVIVSRDTDLEIADDALKEMEQTDSIGILRDEATSMPTGFNENNEKERDLKDEKDLSMEPKVNTQEQTLLDNEVLSRGSDTGLEEVSFANEVKEIYHTDVLQQETTTNTQTELIEDSRNEKELEEDTDLSNEYKDNVQHSTILRNDVTSTNDASNNETDIEDENLVDQNFIKHKDIAVLKTTSCAIVTETKDEILHENSVTTDVTRNESATDSGVYSNSSSVEPNTDIETVLPSHVGDNSSDNKTADTEITEDDSVRYETKYHEDSKEELIETSSVITSEPHCHNKTENMPAEKESVNSQSQEEKNGNILNEIDHERNVYVDMLKDIAESDANTSRTPRTKPVLVGSDMVDDIQKDDIVTARHVMLTQKDAVTRADILSEHEERVTEKPMNLERERTHYSIEKNPLPSIGKLDYIEKSDRNERMKQIKGKRLQSKQQRKDNRNVIKQSEYKPSEILSIEPVKPPDEKLDSQLSASNKYVDDTLPQLVRAPHKKHEDTRDNPMPVVNTDVTQTLTNHERKSEQKTKKKKFSFLPTITNASMFADEFENTNAEIMQCENDSSEIVNNCTTHEPEADKDINLEALKTSQPSEDIAVKETEPVAPPIFKLPDSVNKTKPTKTKRVSHKPKGLSLPNLTGQKRHSAPEFRLPIVSTDNSEASRRPDSFKETSNTLTVPIPENRALVQGSSEAAWVEKEGTKKSKKGRKDNKSEKATGKQKEKQKHKKVSEKPKRKRRRKQNVDVVEDDDEEVDTSKYFDDKERAGKVRPGDKDDLQGLIMRIRENTITDFGFQGSRGSESSEDE